jgi:major membrane immunogen (membrane-anchored lipoprotein)
MKRMTTLTLICAATLLSACGEKARTVGADAAPYTGPTGAMSTFSAPGWKVGDKNSWEQSMKVRAQYGQNDHAR